VWAVGSHGCSITMHSFQHSVQISSLQMVHPILDVLHDLFLSFAVSSAVSCFLPHTRQYVPDDFPRSTRSLVHWFVFTRVPHLQTTVPFPGERRRPGRGRMTRPPVRDRERGLGYRKRGDRGLGIKVAAAATGAKGYDSSQINNSYNVK